MNFSNHELVKKQKKLRSSSTKIYSSCKLIFLRLGVIALICAIATAGYGAYGLVSGIIDNCPEIDETTISPEKFSTTIYDNQKKEIGKLVGSEANRIQVSLKKIPDNLKNAFIAIEDERFYSHSGIDMRGIFRAGFQTISSGSLGQGASTITQQQIKNVLFDGGMETTKADKIVRKVQEQYLALKLEQTVEKDVILENYLNTINLGQNTLGVQAAAHRYFNKDVSKLTLSECAVIAGITKNPSNLNPISNPENNSDRRKLVLGNMLKLGFITKDEYDTALADNVYKRIKKVNKKKSNEHITSYFTDALINEVLKDLQEELNYSESQASNLLYRGGLKIYTTQDTSMQNICDKVISNPANYPTGTKYGISYRLTITDKKGKTHNYDENTLKNYYKTTNPAFALLFQDKTSAKNCVEKYKEQMLSETKGTVEGETLSYTLQPQISFVLMDQHTGEVKALVGGRGTKSASRTLNRATNCKRQPGSTFKVLSAFLPALDAKGMTLATVFDDAPYNYPGTNRQVKNWYKTGYRGLSTIRTAIKDSMNVVAVKTMEQVTPELSIKYLQDLGITTLVTDTSLPANDVNLSTALGGLTYGITNFEATAAYASIANGGTYQEPILYTKIVDHNGKVILDKTSDSRKVFKESTAFLLTSAMQDVVTSGTGTPARFLNSRMPVAGKTGTTSDCVDAWFIGYTPYLTAGIWTGYDDNTHLSTSTYHKIIWRSIMEQIHANYEVVDFPIPETITTATICTKSGKLARKDICKYAKGGSTVRTEYFADHAPTQYCDCHISVNICLDSGLPACDNCPLDRIVNQILLKKDEQGTTADTPNCISSSALNLLCTFHKNQSIKNVEIDKPEESASPKETIAPTVSPKN